MSMLIPGPNDSDPTETTPISPPLALGSGSKLATATGAFKHRRAPPKYLRLLRKQSSAHTLAALVVEYLARRVWDVQSPNTLDAKGRDLAGFVAWFVSINHTGDVHQWSTRDTSRYLDHLEEVGRAPTTRNRVLATLRHFARWVHEQPGGYFMEHGLPTATVTDCRVDEPGCQKLERHEVHRLFKAADNLVLVETANNQRPRRNRAILALLYYTGLRVSELVALRRHQFDGRYLLQVKRKGRARSRGVYVSTEGRLLLDDYLNSERLGDDQRNCALPLFLAGQDGKGVTRQWVGKILKHIACEANKNVKADADRVLLHPHRLRHTFGARHRERSGSDTETAAALGHTGLQYAGRYVRKTDQEREQMFEEL